MSDILNPQILYQNEHFVSLFKPHGWLSVPSQWGEEDPRGVIGKWAEENMGLRLYPVHRLDFDVSGLILFAKSPEAQARAGVWFERRDLTKIYQAISEKSITPIEFENFEWQSMIVRGKKRSFEADHGKLAVTRARLCRQETDRAYWELEPITGRPHQLRFELAKRGFPIVGDALYGAKSVWPEGGVALRAYSLDFSEVPEKRRMGLPVKLRAPGLF